MWKGIFSTEINEIGIEKFGFSTEKSEIGPEKIKIDTEKF